VLTVEQKNRALEAYLLWLFGQVLFTTGHGDTVDARWIPVAREIADATRRTDVTPRSWGFAVLAYTYHALNSACLKPVAGGRPTLSGCPLLLQLWSYERFPIGRPSVNATEPYGEDFSPDYPALADSAGPTFGSLWTRRQVSCTLYISISSDGETFLTCLQIFRTAALGSGERVALL
jgi:hypothetical protein